MVNGVVWPYLHVEPTRYRFRILNACNSRIVRLSFRVDMEGEDELDGDCSGSPNDAKRALQLNNQRINVTMVGAAALCGGGGGKKNASTQTGPPVALLRETTSTPF